MLTVARTDEMPSTELLESLSERFARNLIGGRWQFPAAPYEFEIRSPVDSGVIAVVPLSSRFDVAAAVSAARVPLGGPWVDGTERLRLLRGFLEVLERRQVAIARLQSAESGLDEEDSLCTVRVTLRQLRIDLAAGILPAVEPGVSGHVLSWGAPFTEALTSIWTPLLRGHTVVIKPSLRAPLSAAHLGLLAEESGLPAGVVNVVHGTGPDVGAELMRRQDLAELTVRGGERTTAAARRARTGVPLCVVQAGGNVCVVGPEPTDIPVIASHVAALVRMNNAGGVFGLPLLAVHRDVAEVVVAAVVEQLAGVTAATLPSEPLRNRCLARIAGLVEAGARARLGGAELPDDIEHRMGWRVRPTVLDLGTPTSAAAALHRDTVPLGPVLGVVTVNDLREIPNVLPPRCADGFAWVRGTGLDRIPDLPHATVVTDPAPADLIDALPIPPVWIGDHR